MVNVPAHAQCYAVPKETLLRPGKQARLREALHKRSLPANSKQAWHTVELLHPHLDKRRQRKDVDQAADSTRVPASQGHPGSAYCMQAHCMQAYYMQAHCICPIQGVSCTHVRDSPRCTRVRRRWGLDDDVPEDVADVGVEDCHAHTDHRDRGVERQDVPKPGTAESAAHTIAGAACNPTQGIGCR